MARSSFCPQNRRLKEDDLVQVSGQRTSLAPYCDEQTQASHDAILNIPLGSGTVGDALRWKRFVADDMDHDHGLTHRLLDIGIATSMGTDNVAFGFLIYVERLLNAAPHMQCFRPVMREKMGLYPPGCGHAGINRSGVRT